MRVDHHRVEAGVDAALGLLEGLRLVEEQRDVNRTSRGVRPPDRTEDLDTAAVQPPRVQHHRPEPENHRRGLRLRSVQHRLE